MKKYLLFPLLLGLPLFLSGQALSDDQNYVRTRVFTTALSPTDIPTPDDMVETVTYHDGLGRPMQTVAHRAGGGGQDIITPIVYDELGRQVREYLPYADPQQSGASMSYRDNETVVLPALEGYYLNKYPNELDPNAPNPYSEKVFGASPLNRVLEQGAPGESWKADPLSDSDHTIKFGYLSNNMGEVRRFGVSHPVTASHPGGDTEQTKLEYEGYYHANQLYKTVTKDENWQPGQQYAKDHTTEEFTDKLGRVVLKRTYDKNQRHDTHYVYDDYGNLTYVIPPLASAQIIKGGGVIDIGTINYPWTRLAHVDAGFAEEYGHLLEDYENEAILNLDLENEYGGQGGFSVSTAEGSESVSLSIVFSSTEPLSLRQGELVSLEGFGEFGDTELGVLSGEGYEYYFRIDNNAIVVEGEGEVSAINATFGSTTLSYSENYPWTAYTEVDPDFAQQYEEQLEAYPNGQWLTANIPNEYNGHGGLNISIDEQDKVTVSFTHGSGTPFSLKQGLAIPLEAERRIGDGELGSFSGPGYEYFFSIQENHLLIEGEGELASLNGVLTMGPVIRPYVSVPVVEGLCYIYHYDGRNRVVEKKVPGKGWEHIVYNKLDQPVFIQDANLRLDNDWLFTKYDAFGRVAYTGKYRFAPQGTADNAGRLELQDIMDNETLLWESRYDQKYPNGNGNNINGTLFYYTDEVYPQGDYNDLGIDIYTVNYYDSYAPDMQSEFPDPGTVYGESTTAQAKGLPTGSKVRALGTDDWILSTTYYDEKGRAIYAASHNEYLKTLDVVETDLDFTGKVLKTKSTHTYGYGTGVPKPAIEVEDVFAYDHMGRLLRQEQSINGGAQELIVNNAYDELGQLASKKVGGVVTGLPENSTGLQSIDYAYNIRGWLKNINDPNSLGGDLFSFEIGYDRPVLFGSTPLYNGNISETLWKTANDNQLRKYKYGYDALNRIVTAKFYGGSFDLGTSPPTSVNENYTLNFVGYDKNGNILSLSRSGDVFDVLGITSVDIIDQLSYFYAPQSNTLMKVGDTAHEEGFMDGNTTGDDYDYDSNGNLVMDKNKQIAEIKYNHLNLPTYIGHDDYTKGFLRFVYTATGRKIEKAFIKDYLPYVFDHTYYAGNFVYEKTYDPASPDAPAKLRMFFTPEGYVEPVDPDDYSQGFRYVYQYKDHLGNVRLSYSDVDGNGLINGTLFAEGFESQQGWTSEGAMYGQEISAYDNSRVHSGNYSGRLDRVDTRPHVYVHSDEWVRINNAQATQYTFSGWVYSNGPQAQIFFFMNEDGETQYSTLDDYVYTNVKNQWVYLEKTVSVPANIDKLNLRVGLQYGSVGQSVWFDDVKIEMAGANENEILDERNYYPFGLEHKGYNSVVNGVENNYQTFQGKEHEKSLDLNWHDFHARQYMSDIGRTTTLDPLAENFYDLSPYSFLNNSPPNFIDPTGMTAMDWYKDSGGNIVYNENIDSQQDLDDAGIEGTYIDDSFVGEDQNNNVFYFNGDGSVNQSSATVSMLEAGGMDTSGIVQVESTLIDDGKNGVAEASLGVAAVLVADDATGIGVVDDVLLPLAAIGVGIGVLTETEATYSFGVRPPPGSLVETQPDPTVFPYSNVPEKWSNKNNYFPRGNGNGNNFMKWVIRAAGTAALGKKIYDGMQPKSLQTKIDNTQVKKRKIRQ